MNSHIQEVLHAEILQEITDGLNKPQKSLPSKYFYDEKGSQLFDEICELYEYYPTRTELKILMDNIVEITSNIGDECILVELGSGSSIKIRLLIDHLPTLAAYVPVDISSDHLITSIESLKIDHKHLSVYPLIADYTKHFTLPVISEAYKTIDAFYPGSTIGNFLPDEARNFLDRIAKTCGKKSGLLIGVDLKKDTGILNAAYNDSKNITAEFNLNILSNINNLVEADFNLNRFKHHAFYNEDEGRVEMHLISKEEQSVHIDDHIIKIEENESILTEYSYKYTVKEFADLMKGIYTVENVWVDGKNLFSVQFLRAV